MQCRNCWQKSGGRPERKREAVLILKSKKVSERRSCELLYFSRTSCRYQIKREPDTEFENRVKDLAVAHPRFGYRRVHALLLRSGLTVNRKRVVRIWTKLGLQVPPRTKKKKRIREEPLPLMPQAVRPNETWTYDFMFDRDAAGRRLKLLTLMDEFTREGLAIRVGRSFRSEQVKQVLQQVGAERGFPKYLRSDNGSEFVAEIVKEFLAENRVEAAFIEPGSPWQNGRGESFNGKFRDECLRLEAFGNVREAAAIAEQWRNYYNKQRPHSSLNYKTPAEFRQAWDEKEKLAAETDSSLGS